MGNQGPCETGECDVDCIDRISKTHNAQRVNEKGMVTVFTIIENYENGNR